MAAIIQLGSPSVAVAQSPDKFPDNLCDFEGDQFNYESSVARQLMGQQNALAVSELQEQLKQSRERRSAARIKLFKANVMTVSRKLMDSDKTWTATFVLGRKEIDGLKLTVLSITNPYLDVFNLLGLLPCPNTKLSVVLSVDFSNADLSKNFSTIDNFVPEYPTSSLDEFRPSLRGLKAGDVVAVKGYAQLFLYKLPYSKFESFLRNVERLPPQSPEVRTSSGGPSFTMSADSRLQVGRVDDPTVMIYHAKLTSITKQ